MLQHVSVTRPRIHSRDSSFAASFMAVAAASCPKHYPPTVNISSTANIPTIGHTRFCAK
jgi:hypothetical protein